MPPASSGGSDLPAHRRRYWNPQLEPYYDRVKVTPLHESTLQKRELKLLSDGKIKTSCTSTVLQEGFQPLTGEIFEKALSNDLPLLPPRPCFAPLPTNKRKKLANTAGGKKNKGPEGTLVRAYKVRLRPTGDQKRALKHWFACVRQHYNTAIDIINTLSSGGCAERYIQNLWEHNDFLADAEEDPFFWFQMFRAEDICTGDIVPFKDTKVNEKDYSASFWAGDLDYETSPGLRSMVHDVLTMEPNPDLLAPGNVFRDKQWTQDAPRSVLNNAVEDAIKSLQTNLRKWAANSSHHFNLRFRSLRDLSHTPTESMRIDATRPNPIVKKVSGPISSITKMPFVESENASNRGRRSFLVHLGVQTGRMKGLGPIKATDSKRIADWITGVGYTEMQSELLWDKREDCFYLILNRYVNKPQPTKPLNECSVIGFDPGVRVFQAYSCADGRHGSLLVGARKELRRRRRACSHLQSVCEIAKEKTGYRDPQAAHVKHKRIQRNVRKRRLRDTRWMKHMQYEAIRETFEKGDVVICPILNADEAARRDRRPFGKSVAADLYGWSHYKFRERLWSRSETTPDKHVLFTYEPGTTKTCDVCGCVNDIKSEKFFKCKQCNHQAGRDIGHASRGNILAAIGMALNIGWDKKARGDNYLLDEFDDPAGGEADTTSTH